MISFVLVLVLQFSHVSARIQIHESRNLSQMAIGKIKWSQEFLAYLFQSHSRSASTALSEISRGLGAASGPITILNTDNYISLEFTELIIEIHRLGLQTCIFNKTTVFFRFVEANLKGSLEVNALIFHNPQDLIPKVSFSLNLNHTWDF